jgi:hypothetical protein
MRWRVPISARRRRLKMTPLREAKVKGMLKGDLKRRRVTYAPFVDKLDAIGVVDLRAQHP